MGSLEERFPEVPWRAFHRLHREMPRQGPGSDECTRRALALVGELPSQPVVWDVGCGPGAQTLVLARELGVTIHALDILPHLLAELRQRALREGLASRIETHEGDMAEPFAAEGSVDLIWAEGSVYIVGLDWALEHWRALLRPDGVLAVTEPVWLVDEPPGEARRMWTEEIPGLMDVAGNLRLAEAAGYEVLGHFVLPPSAWLDEYYVPLESRVRRLETAARSDPELARVLEAARDEIGVYRRCSHSYGYAFLVLRR